MEEGWVVVWPLSWKRHAGWRRRLRAPRPAPCAHHHPGPPPSRRREV